jgi:diaminohydroxyphosphoribosylaminopyrimidine deaminase/5-amino-6-(5-phosphoribosylamino)uracil reductase
MTSNEKYMQQALKLARLGGRNVAPNPMVGAVIVKKGKVIGKGYHQKFGGPHAEVNAIRSVKNPDNLKRATMYLTLEPCRHYGKTPPCVDAIQRAGIRRVVCGTRDPFQRRFTIKDLRLKIKFLEGPVAKECKDLNKFYFTWITKKRPFITVKIAMSADGFVADSEGKPVHFTTLKQDKKIHQLRAQHQAIMVGINTVLTDDPKLTVRLAKGKDPLRIILDSKLRIPVGAQVLKDPKALVTTTKSAESIRAERLKKIGIKVWISPSKEQVSLKKLFNYLAKQGISSVLVEPGPILYQSLKKQGLIDELIVYRGKRKLKKGLEIDL